MHRAIILSDTRTPALEACAAVLGASAEWFPARTAFVRALLQYPDDEVVVVCSGDRLELDAAVHEALAETAARRLPGFGEALRRVLPSPLGLLTEAEAVLTEAGRLLLLLPAAPEACEAALPLLAEMVVGLGGDAPQQSVQGGGVTVTQAEEDALPEPEASRWQAALEARGARIDRERWLKLPDELAAQAAARNVLEGAGERAVVVLPDGREAGLLGFPDLRRPSSKVLMVAVTRGVVEVAALHRHPQQVGICGRGTLLTVGSAEAEAMQRTRTPPPREGLLFAVDGGAIYLLRSAVVYRWDGRWERAEGSEAQVTASLLLRWSSR